MSTALPLLRTATAVLTAAVLGAACSPVAGSGEAAAGDVTADVEITEVRPMLAVPTDEVAGQPVREPPRPARNGGQATPPQPEPAPDVSTSPVPSGPRTVFATSWAPFATVGPLTLLHPAARVERIGFHESNHDGARQLSISSSAAGPLVLETRERGTGDRSAADVVAEPGGEIRSPVTGRVLRAGTYVLYCRHSDGYVVIEPDDRPGWEVKLLHITGVRVTTGQRVEAGSTVLADGPTPLPFRSQVDDHTAEPSWPHVHLEVVDTSIPNRPKPGGSC